MRLLLTRSVLLAALVLAAGPLRAGELPPAFTAQYRPAVERLQAAYTRLSIWGSSTLTLPGQDRSRIQNFIMRADGDRRRLDIKTVQQLNMGLTVGEKVMAMATPFGSLITTTQPNHKFFDDAWETKYKDTVARIDSGCLMNYPYSLNSQGTVLDMLLSPAVKVTGMRNFKSGGLPMVEIKYEEHATHNGHSGRWVSSLVLSPSEGWALRGFTRTTGSGSHEIIQRASVTYSGEEDGIPLVQSITAETLRGGRATRQESIEVEDIDLGAPNNEHFMSEAF